MGTVGFGHFNRLRPGLVPAGGSWRAAFPASNVLNANRAKVARSTTAATADTKMSIPLATARSIRAVGFDASNLTAAALVKISLGTSSFGTQLGTTGWVNYLQATGVETEITDEGARLGDDFPCIAVFAAGITTCTYVSFEIDDTANPDGYVELGYAMACPLLVPEVNPEYGNWNGGRKDMSVKQRVGAASWAEARRRINSVDVSFSALTEAEGAVWDEIDRVHGTVGRLLFVPDITDPVKTQREGFICQQVELGMLGNPEYARRGKAVRLEWA